MSSSSDEYDKYAYNESRGQETKRYPVHDCCEFEDAEALKRLLFVPREESDDEDGGNNGQDRDKDGNSSSSSTSDDNDSTAAAHAAAIGHSPQPLRPTVEVPYSKSQSTNNENNLAQFSSTDNVSRNTRAQAAGPARSISSLKSKNEDKSSTYTRPESDSLNKINTGDAPFYTGENIECEQRFGEEASEATAVQHNKKESKFYCPHNLNERDDDENTPLHIAIHARKLEHVKLLLEAGANVHKKSDGSAPVHTAISIGALPQHHQFGYDCVVLLSNYNADMSAKDDSMHTPLYLACRFNLTNVVKFLLSTEAGAATLNTRADRSGGRPLHAAAKFDTLARPCISRTPGASSAPIRVTNHHHPDGSVENSMHHIPGYPGKLEAKTSQQVTTKTPGSLQSEVASEAMLSLILLSTEGIEVNALNAVGQTPLHVACMRGNWVVARLLLQGGANQNVTDRRGFTAGQLAHKRGMPMPVDLVNVLGDPPSSGVVAAPRDLIVDPDGTTLMLSHELCVLHQSCPPIVRDSQSEPPPENVRRLQVLIDQDTGILRCGEFGKCLWEAQSRRAAMVDVLKCHEYSYVESISQLCSSIPDHPNGITHLDADTAVSRWSFEAALRAAGSVCEAVDKVVAGEHRNAFCAVRPPGHHAGPRGIVRCANDPEGGSHGFCLLNNVAIGAAYARSMYRNEGIRRIAIVDFDVHHGNGTEEIVRKLVPSIEKGVVRTPFAVGELLATKYQPWLDETDIQNVFFASTHGYGPRGLEFINVPGQGGWFYPASGKSHISDAITNPAMVETPNLTDFLSSQTWTRMGEDSRTNCCKILNCGLGLPSRDTVPGMQRLELRDSYRQKILPQLRDFDPDIIFISAGFDGHKKDTMNFGYVGMVEDDYEWVTEQLVKIANTCCNGRIVSVLEGGYKIHGGIVSPFARSVASHVRALVDGGGSRELYDAQDVEWESQFERHLVDEREQKRQQKLEKLRHMAEQSAMNMYANQESEGGGEDIPDDPDAPPRKRHRNQVDYRSLLQQMKRDGFAG